MIRYDLKCDGDHEFDSWFQSASAFERLATAGHVTCPQCGSAKVEKRLMAPALSKTRPNVDRPLTAPADPREAALAELRRKVEANSEYVGLRFAAEARQMHEGLVPERAIYGEAHADEARQLIEDGVPVAPLPFLPPRRAN